jgi:hypothetical protein
MEKISENQPLDKLSVGFGVSFLLTSIFNALLVVAKETYPSLIAWMKSLSGHHWITHGIFVIVFFVVLGYVLSKADMGKEIDADKISGMVIAGVVVGGLIIAGYFFMHLF